MITRGEDEPTEISYDYLILATVARCPLRAGPGPRQRGGGQFDYAFPQNSLTRGASYEHRTSDRVHR
jgi:hypothetical protein